MSRPYSYRKEGYKGIVFYKCDRHDDEIEFLKNKVRTLESQVEELYLLLKKQDINYQNKDIEKKVEVEQTNTCYINSVRWGL